MGAGLRKLLLDGEDIVERRRIEREASEIQPTDRNLASMIDTASIYAASYVRLLARLREGEEERARAEQRASEEREEIRSKLDRILELLEGDMQVRKEEHTAVQ